MSLSLPEEALAVGDGLCSARVYVIGKVGADGAADEGVLSRAHPYSVVAEYALEQSLCGDGLGKIAEDNVGQLPRNA